MKAISRKAAVEKGLNRYYTGVPCPKGHVCIRIVRNYACYVCEREKVRRQQLKKPELWRKNARAWGVANRERKQANVRRWKEANPERYKEIQKRAARKWGQTHRDTARAISQRRRSRKINATGTHGRHDIQYLKDTQKSCLCGDSFAKVKSTIDHVVPLSRGGSNWLSNLQLLCQPCNDSKHNKLMSEWIIPNRRQTKHG